VNFIHFPAYSNFYSNAHTYELLDGNDNKIQFAFITYGSSDSADAEIKRYGISKYSLGDELPSIPQIKPGEILPLKIKARVSREKYINDVKHLKKHIHRGDIYEINYCIEFYNEGAEIDPVDVFQRLSGISEAPFSFFSKVDNDYVICASPERFLLKKGERLISQPIKGTRRRDPDPKKDQALIEELRNDKKEQCENVMITDLVRNDLSRIAMRGSVNVEELFGIYSFKQVHQMISTVACTTKIDDVNEILNATFPMGSMTGAPKIRAMELIKDTESFERGLYSGACGLLFPNGDFDLNVMIRSIFYNASKRYLSFAVGSAITANADPEKEYHECLVKARAMFIALGCEDQWNKLINE
jgi:para-aminobenzoate synthetase component I